MDWISLGLEAIRNPLSLNAFLVAMLLPPGV